MDKVQAVKCSRHAHCSRNGSCCWEMNK